jgi:hypothetical protein
MTKYRKTKRCKNCEHREFSHRNEYNFVGKCLVIDCLCDGFQNDDEQKTEELSKAEV